eukprot:jgi/Tetstr1/437487/TSEL_026166.t1
MWRFAALRGASHGWPFSPYYFCTLVSVMLVRYYLFQLDFATYARQSQPSRRRSARGICLLPFVDDFLSAAPTREVALRLCAVVDRLWGRLSLARHPIKAHPEPTQRLKHLGLKIALNEMRFSAPPEKLGRLTALALE